MNNEGAFSLDIKKGEYCSDRVRFTVNQTDMSELDTELRNCRLSSF